MSNLAQKISVTTPLTWSGVPRSEGGTVTGAPGTALYTDALDVRDAETISVNVAVSNVSGATHVLGKSQISHDYDPRDASGTWTTLATFVADMTDDDTFIAYAVSPVLAPWIRFEFSGATSNGAYNRIRGTMTKQ